MACFILLQHKEYKPYETILVLGSQRLSELRDAIKCVSDLQIGGEFSDNPDLAPENICKVKFLLGYNDPAGLFLKRNKEMRIMVYPTLRSFCVFCFVHENIADMS